MISAKGAAAVVWSSKSEVSLREPDQIMYSATSSGTWNGSPSLLAPIAVATPVNTEHFLSCLAGSRPGRGNAPQRETDRRVE